MSEYYNLFIKENKLVYSVAFLIALINKDYDSIKLNQIYTYDTDIGDILDLQSIILLMSNGISEYNTDWINQKINRIEELKKDLLKDIKNINQKLEILSLSKATTDDLNYLLGTKSSPSPRNVKRLLAIEMIERHEPVQTIKQYIEGK